MASLLPGWVAVTDMLRVMSLEQDRIDSYAALVVHVGANVQPGQEVLVSADVAHAADRPRGRRAGLRRGRLPRRRGVRRPLRAPVRAAPRARGGARRRTPRGRLARLAEWTARAGLDPARPATRTRTSSTGSTRRRTALRPRELAHGASRR